MNQVQDFCCGDEPWEIEVAEYIRAQRGTGGALDDMANNGTRVWLYETVAQELVGYGSLGQTQWRWDNPKKGPWTWIHIIPFVGVQTPFQGQPPGPKADRYARRIFDDLLAKALHDERKRRILGLCVHPKNEKAIRFYRDYGFVEYGTNKQGYLRMIVDLRGPDASAPVAAP